MNFAAAVLIENGAREPKKGFEEVACWCKLIKHGGCIIEHSIPPTPRPLLGNVYCGGIV
jgi:hypothetical protein